MCVNVCIQIVTDDDVCSLELEDDSRLSTLIGSAAQSVVAVTGAAIKLMTPWLHLHV